MVHVRAAAVNFADVLVVEGTYQLLPPLPFTPGKELVGVVEAVGPAVDDLAVGDRVIAQMEYGAFRELAVVRAELCVLVPARMRDDEAAAFGLAHLTAHMALVRRARFAAGETVLVTGATGAVGSAAVRVATLLGARVVAAARDPCRAASLGESGADHVVGGDPATLRDQVAEATGGRGADVVVETVGGEVFEACLRCVAWEGRLVVTGFAGGDVPTARAGYLLVKNIGLLGLQVSDYRDREPASMQAVLRWLLDAYDRGMLRVSLACSYPLEQVRAALARVREGGLDRRVVLSLDTRRPGD